MDGWERLPAPFSNTILFPPFQQNAHCMSRSGFFREMEGREIPGVKSRVQSSRSNVYQNQRSKIKDESLEIKGLELKDCYLKV